MYKFNGYKKANFVVIVFIKLTIYSKDTAYYHATEIYTRPLNETKKAQQNWAFFYYYLLPYFFGMSFKISNTNFQYFCAELICARSSGLCAPLMFGPKLIISISG